jgi:AraC family transcriptional regulator, regulatory protein of adaptative response / DNA-3-methyladenine glycosylase II
VILDADSCYKAFRARDYRFDGRFIVAVSSTRVYCRPVCRVRAPKKENCRFFSNPAAAEALGYRPCLRCRPELAPGNAASDLSERLAHAAARLIEDGTIAAGGTEHVASRLGVSSRHLRRIFQAQYGVAPVEFAQTRRLLTAKQLLMDTSISVTDIALASGFRSVRRLNSAFRDKYRITPSAVRRSGKADHFEGVTSELGFRPPYAWEAFLSFLGKRAIPGVELVEEGRYLRTARIRHSGRELFGWIEIAKAANRNALQVRFSSSLLTAAAPVLARVKDLADLSCDPLAVSEVLGPLAARTPGLRVPGAVDGFELAVRAILGQQVSVSAARTLAGRLARAFGERVEAPTSKLEFAFPTATDIAKQNLRTIAAIGITSSRAQSILALSSAVAEEKISLTPAADLETTLQKLQSVSGIGQWTAHYIAMRALRWPDAFLHTDLGARKALAKKSPKEILVMAEAWRPWRSYALMHLWQSLSDAE